MPPIKALQVLKSRLLHVTCSRERESAQQGKAQTSRAPNSLDWSPNGAIQGAFPMKKHLLNAFPRSPVSKSRVLVRCRWYGRADQWPANANINVPQQHQATPPPPFWVTVKRSHRSTVACARMEDGQAAVACARMEDGQAAVALHLGNNNYFNKK